jgi:hypothetical protein
MKSIILSLIFVLSITSASFGGDDNPLKNKRNYKTRESKKSEPVGMSVSSKREVRLNKNYKNSKKVISNKQVSGNVDDPSISIQKRNYKTKKAH